MSRTPLDVLRATADGGTSLAPVHAAMHAELVAIEPGRCTARMPAGPDPVEAVLVLADFVLGLCVTATVDSGERIATLRLAVQMLAAPAPGAVLHAVGVLDHGAGTGVALSSAVITDDGGRAIARATGRNAVLADGTGDTLDGDPPPWGEAPRTWADLVPVEDGAKGATVARPDPGTANTAGVVQGGALAGIAARALAGALGAVPDDLTATFLRAVPADGAPVTCRVKVEHTGRRLRSGRAELRDDRERLLLTAAGLAYDAG